MKIEFYDLETGKSVNGWHMADEDGEVHLLETTSTGLTISVQNNIGWRVVEEVKEPGLVIDWSKVPEQYKWAMIDKYGDFFICQTKPKDCGNSWHVDAGRWAYLDKAVISKPSPDKWRESLIQRPEGAK